MRIAIPYDKENGTVFEMTGMTQWFVIYEVDQEKVLGKEIVSTQGYTRHDLVIPLSENRVDLFLTSHFGEGLLTVLSLKDIKVLGGVKGDTDKVIKEYLDGTLETTDVPHCGCCHH